MNDLPRQTLCEIIAQYGHSLSDDPRRTEALLRDFCGAYKREIFVLVSALREQVAADLLASQDNVPHQVLLAQLTRRLRDNLALAEDAARWAVESWALALGVIERPLPGPPPRGEGESGGAAVLAPSSIIQPLPPRADTDERLLRTLEGHTGWVNSVVFHPDGHILASGSQDGTVRLWDVSAALNTGAAGSQEMQWPLKGTSSVYSVAFSFDGHTLAWGSEDGRVRLWYMAGGREVRWRLRCTSSVYSVAFSPDGDMLASASANAVVLWDVQNGREIRQLKGHTHVVQSVAFSPDGHTLASAGGDETIRLWNVASGRAVQVRRLEGHTESVWSVAFSPDGRTLASGSYDKTVRLWDVSAALNTGVASGRAMHQLEGHAGGVNSVAFSPGGHMLASASLDTVVLWDVSAALNTGAVSGREVRQLKGHTHLVQSVAFSPDGRILASGSWDKTVRLWRVA